MFLFLYEPDGPFLQRLNALPLHHVKMLRVVCKHMRKAVHKTLRLKLAVQRIEKFWSLQLPENTSRFLGESFLNLNLSAQHVRDMEFEQLMEHIKDEDVIKTCKKFLIRIDRAAKSVATGAGHGQAAEQVRINVRVILSAVPIAYFRDEIFSRFEQLEQTVFNDSRPLLDCMHRIATVLAANGSFAKVTTTDLREFPGFFGLFTDSFQAWKVADAAILVERIDHALVGSANALAQVDPFEPLDEPLRTQLRTTIRRLLGRLRDYGRPANLEAFEQIRRTVIPWETLDEHNPFDMEAWNNRAV